MSDYDAVVMFVNDHTRPLTRGALTTRLWEARGGRREDWLRRVAVLVEGGALDERRWPGAARRVHTKRVFAGTRTVEYAVAHVAARIRADEFARTEARIHASTGDERLPSGRPSRPTAKGRVRQRARRPNAWRSTS
jgi:hypothetical protein